MTFTAIRQKVLDYCNLSSTEAQTRVGAAINATYRRITSELGLNAARFVTRSVSTTNGQQYVTFTDIEKIDRVIDATDSTAIQLLAEVNIHEIRSNQPGTGAPSKWALRNTDADSVTILMDTVPQEEYDLQADGWVTLSDLSGSDEPVFPESFHDVLAWYVIAEELLKKEKLPLSAKYEAKADKLLADLKFYLADSPTYTTQQATSTGGVSGGGSGGAGSVGGTAYTQTALLTFDRGAGVEPFAVARSDAPYVPNLGAEFLGNIATDRLIGRDTGGTGETEQISLGNGLSFNGSQELQFTLVFNTRDYGAVGDGVTDDTAAIQAAWDAMKAAGGGVVHSPEGEYLISRLDFTETQGFMFTGAGTNVTRFMAKSGTASYGTATGHLFDFTGSLMGVVRDFQVGAFNMVPEPTTCFFLGQIASGVSNQLHFENVYASGSYTDATLYNYGVASSTFSNCDFYNYNAGAGSHAAMRFTHDNVNTLTSSFATVTSGSLSTSDFSFFGCEFHKFAGVGANGGTVYLDGADSIRFYGGNMSGGAAAYIVATDSPENLIIDGVTFGTESEVVTPTNIITGAVAGLSYRRCTEVIGGARFATAITGTDYLPGGQLQFPATQNASSDANCFDDYREDVWTPVLGGSGGTSGQTYAANGQKGFYVKKGKDVTATFRLELSAKGTITGDVQLQGLPFATDNLTNHYTITLLGFQNLAVNHITVTALIGPNATVATLYGLTAAAASNLTTALATADIADTTVMYGTFMYRATA